MKTIDIEFQLAPPSNNELRRMNHWVYKRLIHNIRDLTLAHVGEGPWPKYTVDEQLPKPVKKKIKEVLKMKWAMKRRVAAEVIIRRVRLFDSDNNDGGLKPLWDAIARAGWMVDDNLRWLKKIKIEQVQGDEPKTLVRLYVPESAEDAQKIEAMQYVVTAR